MFNAYHPASAPLRLPRMLSLALLVVFGTIGMCVGINALVKFEDQKRQLAKAAPSGATVDIDTHDVLNSGYVTTVVCGLLGLAAFIFLLPGFLSGTYASRSLLRVQSLVLGFLTVWLFPTLLAFTDFFANRSAKVTVAIGTFVLPDSLVQQIVSELGASTVYKDVGYREFTLLSTFCFVSRSIIYPTFDTLLSKAHLCSSIGTSGIEKKG